MNSNQTKNYNLIVQANDYTVLAEFEPLKKQANNYQSEAQLETEFINNLQQLGYEYLSIHNESDLITNLRKQIQKLNKYQFSDNEWNQFFKQVIVNHQDNIKNKTFKFQKERRFAITLDNGNSKNIILVDDQNIFNNSLQVINQYESSLGTYKNRYDVTILINGLPIVHIELKRRGIDIKEAFNQIKRYQRESFWSGSGLFEFVQIFVISNGTYTKYYSNTTRFNHTNIKDKPLSYKSEASTSNTFEFTSYWADAKNKTINDLVDFTFTFFAKHTLLNILINYCVFTTFDNLLVMRPYQIAATERIIEKIKLSYNHKFYGKKEAGGYIWHTTGSGKTLTSFKTAILAASLNFIDKVLFVVDRKDLDYQTMREYDRFEKDCANSNISTKVLQNQLEDNKKKIIITTIQKLDRFIKINKTHEVYQKQIVFIFDECHRSQFGDMHKNIIKNFKNYYLFGFTGTPIFAKNAKLDNPKIGLYTTQQTFGNQLHKYTIVNAINDKNVLPFKIDIVKTFKEPKEFEDKNINDIDKESAYLDSTRIKNIVSYILDKFNDKTYNQQKAYEYKFNVVKNIQQQIKNKDPNTKNQTTLVNLMGFNSIMCVSSILAAKKYYLEFKKQNKLNINKALKIATIFSFAPNQDIEDGLLSEENSDDTNSLNPSDKEFLDYAINDYNQMFNTAYDTSSEKFANYYKDVSLRMKNKQIDILIVVNMFLTGFDATTLNTLWVDKNLQLHGLVQAFSRTNRILNSIKTFGNIVCFRPSLKEKTDEAIGLFGDDNAGGICILKTFDDYYYGYNDEKGNHRLGYLELVKYLRNNFPHLTAASDINNNYLKQNEFIQKYSELLKLKNILVTFDEFINKDEQLIDLTEREEQDYKSIYIELRNQRISAKKQEKEYINDDIIFEIELIKQFDINIPYILKLVQKYWESNKNDIEIKVGINKALDASIELKSKKELVNKFIELNTTTNEDIYTKWNEFANNEKNNELKKIIQEEQLKEYETIKFIENCFKQGYIKTIGDDIDHIIDVPISFFAPSNRSEKKNRLISIFEDFFQKYYGVV